MDAEQDGSLYYEVMVESGVKPLANSDCDDYEHTSVRETNAGEAFVRKNQKLDATSVKKSPEPPEHLTNDSADIKNQKEVLALDVIEGDSEQIVPL